MKLSTVSALALVLALPLAACGGPPEDAAEDQFDAPTAAATVAAVASDAPSADASVAASDAPSAAASAAPSAAPSATPSTAATTAAAVTPSAAPVRPQAFAVCVACHSTDPGKNGIGPSLAGIWGEKAGAVAGFDFSEEMIASGLVWNQATLDRYLTDPKGTVPGTKMTFGGVKDAARRQAIIDYLKAL